MEEGTEMKCPICGRNTNDKKPLKRSRRIVKKERIVSEQVISGGRELGFRFGKINLPDECNWCDYERIEEEIKKLKRRKK